MPSTLTAAAIDRAAKKAAKHHYELVRAMLEQGISGEVVTVIRGHYLQPEKRPREQLKGYSVGVGTMERIEG